MAIDVHAHYVPTRILEVLHAKGRTYGISVVERAAGCPCLEFDYGLHVRPFFERVLEPEEKRIDSMDRTGIDRQVLSSWADIFGYGLAAAQSREWHRLLNESHAETCGRQGQDRPDAARKRRSLSANGQRSARELEKRRIQCRRREADRRRKSAPIAAALISLRSSLESQASYAVIPR